MVGQFYLVILKVICYGDEVKVVEVFFVVNDYFIEFVYYLIC